MSFIVQTSVDMMPDAEHALFTRSRRVVLTIELGWKTTLNSESGFTPRLGPVEKSSRIIELTANRVEIYSPILVMEVAWLRSSEGVQRESMVKDFVQPMISEAVPRLLTRIGQTMKPVHKALSAAHPSMISFV
jgi:hypothetical protein